MQLVVCETDEQLRQAMQLRYEVFCLEKGWIDAATCDGEIETDEYDADAVHFLAFHDDGRLLGTCRLLQGSCQELPAARYLDLEALGLDSALVVEVSRMATKRSSRTAGLLVMLGLTQVMLEWGVPRGIKAWVSVADAPLFTVMKRVGMPIIAEGSPVEYLGSTCIPACVDAPHTIDVLAKRGFRAEDVNP